MNCFRPLNGSGRTGSHHCDATGAPRFSRFPIPAIALLLVLVLLLASATAVKAAPQILTQPASQMRVAGQDASFIVEASGTPPLTFQWRQGATDLPGETNAVLTLIQLQPAQGAGYSVVVSDESGSTESDVAVLTVIEPPLLVTEPLPQNAFEGDEVAFSVIATGTDLTYQWKHNGAVLSGATAATLTLLHVQLGQGGSYKVEVANAAGTISSTEVSLTLYQSPIITLEPLDRMLSQGQSTDLSVTADGVPAPAYQWWFNDQLLPGEIGPSLNLPSVQGIQSGNYWVIASNLAGTVTSRVAVVQVIVPPAILQQPAAQSVLPGSLVTFKVITSGSPSTYQWKFNGTALPGATEDTLTLADADPARAGLYQVEIENAAGAVTSSEVGLTVYRAPLITVEPPDRILLQGQSSSLDVAIDGSEPLTYQWWFDQDPLPSAISPTLSLSSIQGSQAGTYWVVISNVAGMVTSRVATVQVIVPPSIVQQPVAQNVLPGSTVSFSVAVTGTPSTYQWKFNGQALTGANGATLTLSDVQPAQTGSYKVDVENAAGSVTSTEVILTVYQAPMITTQPPDRSLNLGQSTSLSVGVTGSEPLHYAWWFNSTLLAEATSATLSLASIQGTQSGSYHVVVSNIAGVVTSRVATVHVIVPPVLIQQPVAQGVFPGTNVTFQVIATGTDLAYQWKFNGSAISGGTNDSLTLSNVHQAQAGLYKVGIENASGAVTSTEVALTVYQAPVITLEPLDRFLIQGQGTNLEVTISGIPAPTSQWWFNGQPLPAATSPTLNLVNAQGSQSGSYFLVASNLAGAATSRVATVEVVVPLAIVQQPVAQSVLPGATVTLSVVATGSSPLYQWKFNGVALNGATNAALTLASVQLAHAGSYKVAVGNAANTVVSTEVSLTVYQAPSITVEPLDRILNQGQSTNLSVTTTGIPAPASQWWFNGQLLPGATSALLNLTAIQGSQSGSYWAVVSNIAGMTTSRVASVLVIIPPAIVQQPASQSVLPGSTVTFNVVATGTALTYQWKLDGLALTGATNASLTLPNVQAAQAGSYKVEVRNAAGTVTSSSVSLAVYQAPVITVQPLDRVLNQGQTTNLSVTANGIPTPGYQWWFNSQSLAGATNPVLTLTSAQGPQSGPYWVVVSNLAGVSLSPLLSS